MSKLIIITGPTAVGKTNLSIQLAKILKTEIISCDSRQVYKELTIGTAKPSTQQLLEVKHHFINHISVKKEYSAGIFQREATDIINTLFKDHEYVIVTGGTGLYLNSLLYNLNDFPSVPHNIVDYYNHIFMTKGLKALQDELASKDPAYYSEVDIKNSRRLIRALSVIKASSKPFSSYLKDKSSSKPIFDNLLIILERDRKELYERINERVELMVEDGLIQEAKSLMSYVSLKALQTVGYQELFPFFHGETSLEFAIDKIKQHSRNYAKRQMTWFRKIENAVHVDAKTTSAETIINLLKQTT